VPIPWSGVKPPFGFGPAEGQPWLPQPDTWADLTVEAQLGDPGSTLSFYRDLLALRRATVAGLPDDVTIVRTAPGSLAFRRGTAGGGLLCMVTCGSRPARVPAEAGELLMTSGAALLTPGRGVRALPPSTAAWFRTR
jgi:alpha-glucosidase